MVRSALRVYHGPEDSQPNILRHPAAIEKVSVTLGEILPVLAEALSENRSWVHDFLDDEVQITTDLYEVLLAVQHYRRPGA